MPEIAGIRESGWRNQCVRDRRRGDARADGEINVSVTVDVVTRERTEFSFSGTVDVVRRATRVSVTVDVVRRTNRCLSIYPCPRVRCVVQTVVVFSCVH